MAFPKKGRILPGEEGVILSIRLSRSKLLWQSFQVDTISGATFTSKAYLQCVENVLIPA
jgi:hypothetical protein